MKITINLINKDWIQLRGTHYALEYLPDDFDSFHTLLTESQPQDSDELTRNWYSNYLDLMDYKRNPNYGRAKCFHCLLSPERDDPIFIGINRLVVIGLKQDENENSPIQYPCPVTNRFVCPCEKGKSSNAIFDVNYLFDLANMAFAVEISLAVARRDTSAIQIKNKQDFYQTLTNRKMFDVILKLVVEEFKPHFYDLLLTDIYMPNMNGFELCEKILELDVNIRVCFMSALEVNIRVLREPYPNVNLGCYIDRVICNSFSTGSNI